MSIASGQAEQVSVIRLEGEMDISGAAELKNSLIDAIESGREIQVSFGAVRALDVMAIQLLWSAQREAARSGVKLTVTGELSEPLQSSLKCLGLNGRLIGAA